VNSRSRLLVTLGASLCLAAALLASPAAASTPAPAWAPLAVSGPTNLPLTQSETQQLKMLASAGTFTLSFEGQTTPPIAFNAEPQTLESALEALSSIGGVGGGVTVVGGPTYRISFGDSLKDTDVPPVIVDPAGLGGTTQVTTLIPGGPGTTELAIYAQNVGGASSAGTITIEATLPPQITTASSPDGIGWTCTPGAGQSAFSCTSSEVVDPGLTPEVISAPVTTGVGASGTKTVGIVVSGGGASQSGEYEMPLTISALPAPPGLQGFSAAAYDEEGNLDTRAGGHPYAASSGIFANTIRTSQGTVVPAGEFKNVEGILPVGFLGNPAAVPQCPESAVHASDCPTDTIVGTIAPVFIGFGASVEANAIANVQAPFGYPAKFKYDIAGGFETLNIVGGLRSDEDYGLTVTGPNTPQLAPVFGFFFTFWGAPADPSHDEQRCTSIENHLGCGESHVENTAFLTEAVNCAEQAVTPPSFSVIMNTWQFPELLSTRTTAIPAVTGCDQLHFDAGFSFRPDKAEAGAPAGFVSTFTQPVEGLKDPGKRLTPEPKKIVVHLPEGVAINPAAADGLGACTSEQIGLKGTHFPLPNRIRFDKNPVKCPDSSKVGTIELSSALLTNTLPGNLYLAAQGDNPFGSTFAVYLVIDDPQTGTRVKLPGLVEPDPLTGQMTATFDDNPQLPVKELKLTFKGGPRAPLANPQTCGTFTTTTEMTPWSAPESGGPLHTEDSFTIDKGANGAPCADSVAQLPFDLGFTAGTTNPLAGAHSPFTMHLTRPDGAQSLSGLELSTPEGFSATLKGVPYCSEARLAGASSNSGRAEQASSSCPSASRIGSVEVGAGSGPSPFYVPGKVYLAGPYKGSQISLAAVVPAVAGPFDLGVQVVRVALHLNPRTAQLTAVSDPIPQILDGVPLRVRDVRVSIDRPNFALNPTDCSVQQVSAKAGGSGGATANLSNRFQVGGCEKLGFKPKLSLKLKGGTKRGGHPALRATLTTRPGDANFASAAVTLPHSAFLDQAHIRTICTRVQFAADQCPKGAIYGYAKAITPLLDDPVQGPVYLRSSDNKLPDLVVDLGGQVDVEVVGRIDSVHGGIRNVFDVIPDAPVSKFELSLQGGKKGLVINSRDLCASPNKATVKFGAQNGLHYDFRPEVVPTKCKKAGKGKRHGGRR
jgi:hypothetical protein